jgi:streptogramin lyase
VWARLLVCVELMLLVSPADALARVVLRLADRAVSVSVPQSPARIALVDVTVDATRRSSVTAARSDFRLSAGGDMVDAQRWNAGRAKVTIAPGPPRTFRLSFGVASGALRRGALFYRPADARGASGVLPLDGSPAYAAPRVAHPSTTVKTFSLAPGVGNPWGTAIDGSGQIWFAEPGCDFAPVCPADAPPGQIGVLDPSSGAVTYYTLPSVPGNQPIFLAFDGSGKLWFTTPDNSMIGEFDPATRTFVGQWPVTPGSGPWDLTFAAGQLWYTEHLASAVGMFNPATHTHQDFQTPSANSNPYGIAASGGLVWFTENSSSVDRVAVLDTTRGNAISEYPIVLPFSGTPHLIAIGPGGQPWWTEGWGNTIATLDPALAKAGDCGVTSGNCNGIQRFRLPSSTACGGEAHTSGIAFQPATGLIWLDNSLTAQVGSFTPSTGAFDLTTLGSCGAHPHDGLTLDRAGNVWFDEEFANSLGELIAPASGDLGPASGAGSPGAGAIPGLPIAGPSNTAAPTIHGRPRQAHTLIATKGSWTNNPTAFTYTWQRCDPRCATVAAGRSDAYRVATRDIDATVRVIVTAGNAVGSARARSPRVGPVGPSLVRVKRSMAALLTTGRHGWTIAELLRKRLYVVRFRAPSRGSLWATWRAEGQRAVVATAHGRFSRAGGARLVVRVTPRGASILDRARRLPLVAKGIYIPTGERSVTRVLRWTLN